MNLEAHLIRAVLIALLSYGCASDDADPRVPTQSPDLGAHDQGVDSSQEPDSAREPDSSNAEDTELDEILAALEADFEATVFSHANDSGWPLAVTDGHLFVTRDQSLTHVAGDHDEWSGVELEAAAGFSWVVLDVSPGNRYKFTNLADRWPIRGRALTSTTSSAS